jgi:hypothetical protein
MGGGSTKSRVRSEPQISPLRVLRIGFINFFFLVRRLVADSVTFETYLVEI